MKAERKKELLKFLKILSKDIENDVRGFDGKPLNGETVGTYFGYHAASLNAIIDVLKEMLEDKKS